MALSREKNGPIEGEMEFIHTLSRVVTLTTRDGVRFYQKMMISYVIHRSITEKNSQIIINSNLICE